MNLSCYYILNYRSVCLENVNIKRLYIFLIRKFKSYLSNYYDIYNNDHNIGHIVNKRPVFFLNINNISVQFSIQMRGIRLNQYFIANAVAIVPVYEHNYPANLI